MYLLNSSMPSKLVSFATANCQRHCTWISLAQVFDRRRLLLFADLLVLLLVRGCLQPLPRKAASQKIQEHMPKSLEVVSPGLLSSEMRVDAHIACRARQRLSLPVRNMLLRLGVSVLLGHPKVDDMDHVGRFCGRAADEEVVRLDVSVNEILLVDGLDSRQLQRD